jgi:hypothetical protein
VVSVDTRDSGYGGGFLGEYGLEIFWGDGFARVL